jgi:uncharacterized protein (TIGR02145 family)
MKKEFLFLILLMLASSCKKEKEVLIEYGTVSDIEGNTYKTVKIGGQEWMAENLITTKYSDGSAIPNITDKILWAADITGAYCDYSNNPSNSVIYGRLYNWYIASSNNPKNVCPTGWHVPLDEEWTTFEVYLGGIRAEDSPKCLIGGKLKETGLIHWDSPNSGATNKSGFSGLPGGGREPNGFFQYLGTQAVWWSATEAYLSNAWSRNLLNYSTEDYRTDLSKNYGLSVRCVRDL